MSRFVLASGRTRLVGYRLHPVQQPEFLPPDLLRSGVTPEPGFGLAVGGLDQVFLLGFLGGLGVGGQIPVFVGFGIRAQGSGESSSAPAVLSNPPRQGPYYSREQT